MPASNGERVVLRLLDKQAGRLDLGSLGMDPDSMRLMDELIHKPHGIILVTGPTGSGKTTLLFQVMEELERQLKKLERMHPDAAESSLVRTYLDWLVELPWSARTTDNLQIDVAEKVLDEIVSMRERPKFTKIASGQRTRRATAYLGIVPDYGAQGATGVKCTQVNPGSPAAKGDLKPDDVIIKIGDVDVTDMRGLTGALRKFKAGDKVKIIVRRDDSEVTLDVTLGTPGG